jgi:hypothetical protein
MSFPLASSSRAFVLAFAALLPAQAPAPFPRSLIVPAQPSSAGGAPAATATATTTAATPSQPQGQQPQGQQPLG